MAYDAHSAYQHSEILDASPTRLVILLYRGAIEAVVRARAHQLAGERRERATQISRAFELIAELSGSVDRDKGGDEGRELALRLLQLYDYMQEQLNRANVEQIVAPLDEVEKLLGSLLEGWEGAQAQLSASSVQGLSQFAGQGQTERKPISLSA
jgi:flagellar secretion chaperone FliS